MKEDEQEKRKWNEPLVASFTQYEQNILFASFLL